MAIQQRRRRLGGEEQPAAELPDRPRPGPGPGRLPLAGFGQPLQGGPQGLGHPIELVDQQAGAIYAGQ